MFGKKGIYPIFRIFAGAVPAIIIISLFLFPSLLNTNASLVPLEFIEAERTDGSNMLLKGCFSLDLPEKETVWLYAENAQITVNAAGNSYHFNEPGDTPDMFRSAGSSWYSFASPGITSGETVEIEVRSYYGRHDRAAEVLISRLYMGDGSGLLRMMLSQIDFFSIVLIFAAIAGIIYLTEGMIDIAFGVAADGKRIALFGFYCFSGGLWCMTDTVYPYISLFLSEPWVVSLINMSGMLLFPISQTLLLRFFARGKRSRIVMGGIAAAEIIIAIFLLLLQAAGRADLIEGQFIVSIFSLAFLSVEILCIIMELHKYRDNYLLPLVLTVLPVFACEILVGINDLFPLMQLQFLKKYSFGFSILLLILQFVSYANSQLAKTKQLNDMENELVNSRISIMLTQIQPHFLYNSLQGIKLLCDTDSTRASEALEHFSFYLRGNLDSLTVTQLIPFKKELIHIKDYLYLEKMRFEEELNIRWELNCMDFMIPSLTVQPLVENAIRHGLNKKAGGGTLTIRSERTENGVVITIEDDGVGFEPGEEEAANGHSHIGIENTRSRLKLLCGGSLQIKSEKGIGTKAVILLH